MQTSEPTKGLQIPIGETPYWSQYVNITGSVKLKKIKVVVLDEKNEEVAV
jgi:hypothetical protein